MHTKKKAWIVITVLVLLIKLFSFFPFAVEKYYSNGVYPLVSRLLRFLFGWVPFSIGDLLYLAVAILLLAKTFKAITTVFRRQANKFFWWDVLRWLLFYSMVIYVVFNSFWGLNYNRLGMAYQMQLELKPYTNDELSAVVKVLVERLDTNTGHSLQTRNNYLQKDSLFASSQQCYARAAPQYPHLMYHNPSIKSSLYNYLGDYMGYMGYYNPFTGEAQVNTSIPVFVRPFTTCHEMGHQLGYAKENEANFAGYLSAKSSADAAFLYSVYFDLYSYGIRELYGRDSLQAIALNKQKPVQVKDDVLALRKFFRDYENPFEPYIRRLYAQYLKANEQPSGMQSYNEVIAFLVAYYKKYGAAAL